MKAAAHGTEPALRPHTQPTLSATHGAVSQRGGGEVLTSPWEGTSGRGEEGDRLQRITRAPWRNNGGPGNQEQACLPHWTGVPWGRGALGTGRVFLITWGFHEGGAASPFTLGVLRNRNGVLAQTSILGPLPPPCYGGSVGPYGGGGQGRGPLSGQSEPCSGHRPVVARGLGSRSHSARTQCGC